MNLSRYFKILAAALLAVSLAAGTAAAISVSDDGVPEEAQVGEEVTATYTFTELYGEYDSWTLHGETNLTNVTWTVTKYNLGGDRISRQSYDGGSFDAGVDTTQDTAEVVVRVRGTAPEIETFSYESEEMFQFAAFEQVREGGTENAISATSIHHYTEASKEARNAIESAQAAIDAAGGDSEAESTVNDAIAAYNNEEFTSATTFAQQAEQQAQQAESTQSRNQLILYAVVALVVVGLLVGGILYWRSQQDSYDKLG